MRGDTGKNTDSTEFIFEMAVIIQQGNSEGFHSYDRPSNLTQIGFAIIDF